MSESKRHSESRLRLKYASQFGVPDGGAYRNDWPDRIDAVLAHVESLEEQLEAAQRKVDAYDRARAQVKIEGATRAELVLRAEASQEQHGFLERDLAFVRANTDSIRDYNEKLTKEVTRLREQFKAHREAVDAFFKTAGNSPRPCWDSFCGGGSHTALCRATAGLWYFRERASSSAGSPPDVSGRDRDTASPHETLNRTQAHGDADDRVAPPRSLSSSRSETSDPASEPKEGA